MGRFLAYSYANNNPISFKDPTGLEPKGEKGKDKMQRSLLLSDLECRMRNMQIIGELQTAEYLAEQANLFAFLHYRFNNAKDILSLMIRGRTAEIIASASKFESGDIIDFSFNLNGVPVNIKYSKSGLKSQNISVEEALEKTISSILLILANDKSSGIQTIINNYGYLCLDFTRNAAEILQDHQKDKNDYTIQGPVYGRATGNGIIYLTYELLGDDLIHDDKNYNETIYNENKHERRELWHVMAHEIGHLLDWSNDLYRAVDPDVFAEHYLENVYNNYYLNKKIYYNSTKTELTTWQYWFSWKNYYKR